MHEAGIAEELLVLAERAAREAKCRRILRVVVRVGALSSVVPEALAFAFAALKEGTWAAEAVLDVERVPATAWCAACEREFVAEDVLVVCPDCGAPSGEVRRGRELDLVRIEAE